MADLGTIIAIATVLREGFRFGKKRVIKGEEGKVLVRRGFN